MINVFAINIELKVIVGLALLLVLIVPFSECLLEDLSGHGHVGRGPRVIHLVHGHTHLGVNNGPGQLGNVEKEACRHAQQNVFNSIPSSTLLRSGRRGTKGGTDVARGK